MAESKKEWEEVGGGDLPPTWNYKEDKEIVGVYTGMEENVGPNASHMYYLENKDGEKVGVWGTALLDQRFSKVEKGTEVRIVYNGKTTSPKTGRSYHDFSFYKAKE